MNTNLWKQAGDLITASKKVVVIQAENPDGDSLGSAMALEELLGELGKEVVLYSYVDVPKYLRYIRGWDRVTNDFPTDFDLSVFVDCSAAPLLERTFEDPAIVAKLQGKPSIIFDHHGEVNKADILTNLLPSALLICEPTCVATTELLHDWAVSNSFSISPQGAEHMLIAILSDSLGMTTPTTTAHTLLTAAHLIELGAHPNEIENRRREFMKKSPEILQYKGRLLQRVAYYTDGQLAVVHIPWDEIAAYSDQYNPSMLVMDEMRLVEGVRVAVAIKTYPDGKLTAKIRCNSDATIADKIAAHFGGGGHPYAAGFKIHSDSLQEITNELAVAVSSLLREIDEEAK